MERSAALQLVAITFFQRFQYTHLKININDATWRQWKFLMATMVYLKSSMLTSFYIFALKRCQLAMIVTWLLVPKSFESKFYTTWNPIKHSLLSLQQQASRNPVSTQTYYWECKPQRPRDSTDSPVIALYRVPLSLAERLSLIYSLACIFYRLPTICTYNSNFRQRMVCRCTGIR